MDKQIKKHFAKSADTPKEKKLLGKVLKADKKLDKAVKQDDMKKGKKVGKA